MAIIGTEATKPKKPKAAAAEPQAQAVPGATIQEPVSAGHTTIKVNNEIPYAHGISPMFSSSSAGLEAIERLEKLAKAHLSRPITILKDGEFALTRLMKEDVDNSVNYSSLIVSLKTAGKVFSHILMIERTGKYPVAQIQREQNEVFEIVRTPAEALDRVYSDVVKSLLANKLNVDIKNVSVIDGTLIPNELSLTDDSSVLGVISNAVNSLISEYFITVEGYTGVPINEVIAANPGGGYFVSFYFNGNNEIHTNQVGMPIRHDICIELSFKSKNQSNSGSVNQSNSEEILVKTYGYIDFEYSAPPAQYGMRDTRRFIPNFIITHIESPKVLTPSLVLLAIASTVSIHENENWMRSFQPSGKKKGKEINYNDVGALNIEGNIEGSPSNYGSPASVHEYDPLAFVDYMRRLCYSNMIISIDVPSAGPETWYTSVFNSIALQTGLNQSKAYERLTDAATTITNGHFNVGVPVFHGTTNLIHGGYYRNMAKDRIEDVRVLSSYLGMANYVAFATQSPLFLTNYFNTLYRVTAPERIRAAHRDRMIQEASGGTAHYNQYYNRLSFNSAFISELLRSLSVVGFAPLLKENGINMESLPGRFAQSFEANLLGADARITGQANLYSGYGHYAPAYGMVRTY